jgi:hypothetical protein
MKRLVQFPMENGDWKMAEVDEQDVGGTVRAARGQEEKPEKAPQSFEQALSKVRPATERVVVQLQSLSVDLDEVEMEFGFNLSGEFGAIIAKASAEANYKVTLRWSGNNKGSGKA